MRPGMPSPPLTVEKLSSTFHQLAMESAMTSFLPSPQCKLVHSSEEAATRSSALSLPHRRKTRGHLSSGEGSPQPHRPTTELCTTPNHAVAERKEVFLRAQRSPRFNGSTEGQHWGRVSSGLPHSPVNGRRYKTRQATDHHQPPVYLQSAPQKLHSPLIILEFSGENPPSATLSIIQL